MTAVVIGCHDVWMSVKAEIERPHSNNSAQESCMFWTVRALSFHPVSYKLLSLSSIHYFGHQRTTPTLTDLCLLAPSRLDLLWLIALVMLESHATAAPLWSFSRLFGLVRAVGVTSWIVMLIDSMSSFIPSSHLLFGLPLFLFLFLCT